MVFALHSKVVQNLAAVVEFVRSIIKTLNCCANRDRDLIVCCTSAGLRAEPAIPYFI